MDQTLHLEMEKKIREATRLDNVVILGDFNYPHVDWVNMRLSHLVEMRFLEIMNDCALEQLITKPTREVVVGSGLKSF